MLHTLPSDAARLLRIGAAWAGGKRPSSTDLVELLLDLARVILPDSADQIAALLLEDAQRQARSTSERSGGRPVIDDANRLAEVAWLVENGKAASIAAACSMVARAGGTHSVDSTAARLRRKYRASYVQNKTS
jgi:hypothetical protein